MLYNCQSLFIHIRLNTELYGYSPIINIRTLNYANFTYSYSINEFFISDVAISVLVEVVVNAGELLSGHEATKL